MKIRKQIFYSIEFDIPNKKIHTTAKKFYIQRKILNGRF